MTELPDKSNVRALPGALNGVLAKRDELDRQRAKIEALGREIAALRAELGRRRSPPVLPRWAWLIMVASGTLTASVGVNAHLWVIVALGGWCAGFGFARFSE